MTDDSEMLVMCQNRRYFYALWIIVSRMLKIRCVTNDTSRFQCKDLPRIVEEVSKILTDFYLNLQYLTPCIS